LSKDKKILSGGEPEVGRSLTEFGSSFQPEKSDDISDDASMNTVQHNLALE
jgi:hypothetical protein